MKDIGVNIVNWNGQQYLEGCLDSVLGLNQVRPEQVIIVDNGSTDGSREFLERKYPGIKLIKNDRNTGFCHAHNQGILQSAARHVLLLNFDVVLTAGFLEQMINSIESDPRVGMVSGKLLKQVAGRPSELIDSTGIEMPYYFMRPRGENERDNGGYDAPEQRDIFGPCGAAPLYRREMLEDIKCREEYFDEDYFNYVEDVDLAWRAQLRGWKGRYNPLAVAYHERGATRKGNPRITDDYYVRGLRNRYFSMIKNLTREEWKKYWKRIIGVEMVFIWGDFQFVRPRLQAFLLAWKGSLPMREKRKLIQPRRTVPVDYLDNFFKYQEMRVPALIRAKYFSPKRKAAEEKT